MQIVYKMCFHVIPIPITMPGDEQTCIRIFIIFIVYQLNKTVPNLFPSSISVPQVKEDVI